LEAGRADRPVLDGRLVESDLGVARPAILVRDAQRHPRVHEGLAGTALAGSYIAVPLLAGGRVVGLVHADCYYRRREPDELAGRLLGGLAEVLAQALLRAAATEQLAALGSELTRLSGSLPRGDRNAPPDVSLRAPAHVPGGQDQPTRCPSTARRYRLTRRQVEVLELVAEGHTNAVIGRKLFITQDTVKSHVKLLLRKFNAGNRAAIRHAVIHHARLEHRGAARPGAVRLLARGRLPGLRTAHAQADHADDRFPEPGGGPSTRLPQPGRAQFAPADGGARAARGEPLRGRLLLREPAAARRV